MLVVEILRKKNKNQCEVFRGNHFSAITLQFNTAIYGNITGRVAVLKDTLCFAFSF
jgi:hypothetical protein